MAVGGVEHQLPRPFHVLATQNPIEQEGTYPLPEAQLDRFLLKIGSATRTSTDERAMLLATTGTAEARPNQALTPEELIAAQALIRRVPVGETVLEAILRLVRGGRPETAEDENVREHVAWGPGPRAAQALMLACRARAVLDGRLVPSVDDVAALAHPVLRHRMALKFSAPAGLTLARRDRPAGGAYRVSLAARGAPRHSARICRPLLVAAETGRGDGGAGRSWPPPGRPGRQFLAVPPIPARRPDHAGSTGACPPAPTRTFVRETEWEAAQTVCLWRDGGASMRWKSRSAGRAEGRPRRADAAGAGVAAAARRRAGAADRPGRPRGQRPRRPGPHRRANCCGAADRRRLAARARLPRHARVVLIGDLLSPLEQIQAAIAQDGGGTGHRHAAAGARPGRGDCCRMPAGCASRAWRRAQTTLIPRVESVRADYTRSGWPRSSRASPRICAAAGWGFAVHRTDHPPEAALLALYTALAPRRRGAPMIFAVARGSCSRWRRCRCCGGCCGSRRRRRAARAFPAVRLLLGLTAVAETPARTPWWLLLLRMARRRPGDRRAGPPGAGRRRRGCRDAAPVLLVVDDGWASAGDWPRRMAAADTVLDRAERAGRQAALLATAAAETGAAPAGHRRHAGHRSARAARRAAAETLAGRPRRRRRRACAHGAGDGAASSISPTA